MVGVFTDENQVSGVFIGQQKSFQSKLKTVLMLHSLVTICLFLLLGGIYLVFSFQQNTLNTKSEVDAFAKALAKAEVTAMQTELLSRVEKTQMAKVLAQQSPLLNEKNDYLMKDIMIVLNDRGTPIFANRPYVIKNIFSQKIFNKSILTGHFNKMFLGSMFLMPDIIGQKDAQSLFVMASVKVQAENGKWFYLVQLKKANEALFQNYNMSVQNDQIVFDKKESELNQKIKEAFTYLLVLLAGLFLVVTVSAGFFTRRLTAPIQLFLEGIKSYSETGYGYKISLFTQDEFGKLAEAFNAMIESSRLSLIDPMTELFNRRYLDGELIKCCLSAHRKKDQNLSLAVFDIDFFKKINDVHGHAVGDEAIKFLANFLKSSFRTSDVIARFGGEEFVVILKDSSLDGACEVCERIKSSIAEQHFISTVSGNKISFTVSCGVANAVQANYSSNLLFELADQALYKSKESGRNRVTKCDTAYAKVISVSKAA